MVWYQAYGMEKMEAVTEQVTPVAVRKTLLSYTLSWDHFQSTVRQRYDSNFDSAPTTPGSLHTQDSSDTV
jgi:hypothetical protein